jgi:hypothetical protein
MMDPAGSNGEEGPTSTTKPLSFSVLFHVTFVPTFTQKSELLLAFGMLGVEEAESEVRFTSTVQGLDVDPQVLAAVHNCAGLGSEQAYLSLFDWELAWLTNTRLVRNSNVQPIAKYRQIFIVNLTLRPTPDHPGSEDIRLRRSQHHRHRNHCCAIVSFDSYFEPFGGNWAS